MDSLIRGSIRFPHTVFTGTFLLVLFGWIAATSIPLQMRPSVDKPEITVTTQYPGASPEEVEDKITRPIEEALNAVEGVKKLTSTSTRGRSRITLEFDWNVDRNAAMVDVLNKLGRVTDLPEEALAPVAEAISSDTTTPMMWIGLQSKDPKRIKASTNRMRTLIDDVIEPRFRRVEGVGSLIISGGQEREVRIQVDLPKLAHYRLSLTQLIATIRKAHLTVRGGPMDAGKREYVVWTSGRATTLKALEQVVLSRSSRGIVRIKDIAKVKNTFKRKTSVMHLNGLKGIAMGILRKTGSNVPATAKRLEQAIAELNKQMAQKQIPYRLRVLFTEVSYINQSLSLVRSNLLLGSVLAVFVLLLFLGSFRSVLVISFSIPISLITVFLVMKTLGRSLNIISLAGLAFAVGMVVDNAIVVLENIYRFLHEGHDPETSSYEGTKEVALAITASTLTTVAVFLPIVFLNTEAGQIFKDIALAISTAVLFSLLVSITFLPMACRLILKAPPPRDPALPEKQSLSTRMGSLFERVYQRILRTFVQPEQLPRRLALGMLVTALFVVGMAMLPSAEYLPTGNRNLILTLAKPLPGTNLDKVTAAVAPYEKYLLKRKETQRLFTVFNARFNAVGMILKPEYSDAKTMRKVLGELRRKAFGIAGFRFMFPILASIFRTPGKQFEIELSGPDLKRLQSFSRIVKGQLRSLPGVIRVRSDFEDGALNLQVYPKRQALQEKGLSAAALGEFVQVALGGLRVGYYLSQGREVDLTLIGQTKKMNSPNALRNLSLVSQKGKLVPLTSVATVKERRAPTVINRLEMLRSITLTVNLANKASLGAVLGQAKSRILQPLRKAIPTEYSVKLGGTADRLNETLRDLTSSFLLALLISYLLMVALFRSFFYPFIIMFTVPMAATGACLAVGWTGVSFDTITMLGFIILSGIVVNNAILMVSQILTLERAGMPFEQALVEGSSSRLRPIMMTAITSIFGMLPLAMGGGAGSELYRGLGIAIVGGLAVSTFVTLFLVPALLVLVEDIKRVVGFRSST